MILYCFCFTLGLSGEWKPQLTKWMMILLPIGIAFSFSSIVHPFLLADNRHLSFYIWRRILSKWWIRQIILPIIFTLYVPLAWKFPKKHHQKKKDDDFVEREELVSIVSIYGRRVLLFCVCSMLTIALTPVLEFRYFLLPSLLAVVFQPLHSAGMITEIFGLGQTILVNLVVLGVFFGRSFEDEASWGPGPQRIMW